jgi:hypothetical protein
MNTVSSRLYLPGLGRWRPLVVAAALLAALILLALGAAIVAGTADNQPAEQFLAPFRWWQPAGGMA